MPTKEDILYLEIHHYFHKENAKPFWDESSALSAMESYASIKAKQEAIAVAKFSTVNYRWIHQEGVWLASDGSVVDDDELYNLYQQSKNK